jgi:signal transduction histidine kinase
MERSTRKPPDILPWIKALIPFQHISDDRSLRKARLLVMFYLASAVFLAVFAGLYWITDYTLGVWACLYGSAIVPVLLAVFRSTGSFKVTTIVFDLNAILMLSILIYGTGGTASPVVPWLAIVPASGFVFAGWKRGLFMSLLCLVEIMALLALERSGYPLPMLYDQSLAWLMHVAVQVGLVAYIFMILMIYESSRERTIMLLDRLNADLLQRKQEVEQQREELARRNAEIAEINSTLEVLVELRTAKLAQANDELDTFLYESAHALRRPMARIMGLVTIVREEEDPVAVADMHDHIDTSLLQMDQMLRSLITVSELNVRRLEVRPHALRTVVEAVVASRHDTIRAADPVLEIAIAPSVEVTADRFLLELAIGYVLDNALQYTVKTGRKPTITIAGTSDATGMATLTLQDNGLGIAASEIGRLTEMFFRATAQVPGNGLGLYVAQKALDRIGGSLQIESQLDVGTTVTLHVPPTVAPRAVAAE